MKLYLRGCGLVCFFLGLWGSYTIYATSIRDAFFKPQPVDYFISALPAIIGTMGAWTLFLGAKGTFREGN